MPSSQTSPSKGSSLPGLVLLGAVLAGSGCSKGSEVPGGGTCRRLGDPDPMMQGGGPVPADLYAELLQPESATVVPVPLDGIGGNYSGLTPTFDKCQSPIGSYYVQRTFLFNVTKTLVATALRDAATGGYRVTYQNGMSTVVSGAGFSRNTTTVGATPGAPPMLQNLAAGMTSARQGDKVTITAAATAAADDCGISQMQWWLTITPGVPVSGGMPATLSSGGGASTLRIPADLPPTTYYVEGRIVSKQGRTVHVRRQFSTDTTYKYLSDAGTLISDTGITTIPLTVVANPDADRQAPQGVSLDANPTTAARCQPVQLSLKLSDDKALPASQEVTLLLGPIDQPALTRVKLSGSGDTLYGTFTVPLDAPSGVWFGYPQSIVDEAGNVGTGTLSQNGKFTITGPGISTPRQVQAATFVVQGATPTIPLDGGGGTMDFGTPADMLTVPSFPATLSAITVTPASLTGGQAATVNVVWIDNSDPKMLK